jgi:response regulator RpfG family c-di-GMP phosphodiesterase
MNTTAATPARILCVDDERSVLMAIKRLLRGSQYKVTLANSGREGLDCIADEDPFDLIISDMRMPEMDGAEFLAAASKFTPHSIRILLTGYSDQEATTRAINDGKIFRYLNKPWNNDELRAVVEEAIELKRENDTKRHRKNRLEKATRVLKKRSEALEAEVLEANQELQMTVSFLDLAKEEIQENYLTLIKSLASLINFRIGNSHQMANCILDDAVAIAQKLNIEEEYIEDIKHAAMLCQLGKVAFSDKLLATPLAQMTPEERKKYYEYPVVGEQVLMPIEALNSVAKIIRHHNENFDGQGYPDKLMSNKIPLACRVLRLCLDFNTLLKKDGYTIEKAQKALIDNKFKLYDPELVDLYLEIMQPEEDENAKQENLNLTTQQLKNDMIVAADMYNQKGLLILSKNSKITDETINKLKSFERMSKECFTVQVYPSEQVKV